MCYINTFYYYHHYYAYMVLNLSRFLPGLYDFINPSFCQSKLIFVSYITYVQPILATYISGGNPCEAL